MRTLFTRALSFIDEHPKLSLVFLCVMIAKVVLAIFTPLSEDFLNSALFIGPLDLWALVKADGAYFLWMLMEKGIYTVWQLLPLDHPPMQSIAGFWYFIPSLSSQVLILLLKLPLIIFDGLCAFAIYKIAFWYTGSSNRSLTASALWLLNPYVTITSEMFGNYDVIVVFFFLMSIFYFLKGRYILTGATLMVSTFLKPYPILLLPIFIIVLGKQKEVKGALKFGATVILFAVGILIPLLSRTSALKPLAGLLDYYFEKGSTFFIGFFLETYATKTSYIHVQIGLTIVLCVLYIFVMSEFWQTGKKSILDAILGFCLIIFGLSFWHPQLLLWILPIITLDYLLNRTPRPYPILFTLTAFLFELIYFSYYFASHGHSFFFIPDYNTRLFELSQLILGLYKAPLWIGPIAIMARSIFMSICIFYVIRILLRNTHITVTNYSQNHDSS